MKIQIANNLIEVCGDVKAVEKSVTEYLGERLMIAGVKSLIINEIGHPMPNGSGHYKIALEVCINSEGEILTTDTTNMSMIDEWRLGNDELKQGNTCYTSLAEIATAYISNVLINTLF